MLTVIMWMVGFVVVWYLIGTQVCRFGDYIYKDVTTHGAGDEMEYIAASLLWPFVLVLIICNLITAPIKQFGSKLGKLTMWLAGANKR